MNKKLDRSSLIVRVDTAMKDAIDKAARDKGLDRGPYVRMAVIEQLKRDGQWKVNK